MEKILNVLEPTQVYLIITFINGLVFLDKSRLCNKLLFIILTIMTLTEILSSSLLYFSFKIDVLYTLSIIVHNVLWLYLIYSVTNYTKGVLYMGIFFLVFAVCNILFMEGIDSFNHYTFIVGAFTYIICFIFISFMELRAECFLFFRQNQFLLLFSPILFFFGLSFVMGFRSKELASEPILGDFNLYQVIGYFVNIIYYTLLNLYIFKERKTARKKVA